MADNSIKPDSNNRKILSELAKAKAIFQQRAILAAMGVRSEQITIEHNGEQNV